VHQYAGVVGRESKSVGEEVVRKAGLPFPRALLKSIETPFEFAHCAVYPAPERKTHVDLFFQVTVEDGGLDIKLAGAPLAAAGYGK
jgi:hypothetical protein